MKTSAIQQGIFATLLGLPVFLLASWNFIRFYAAITRWEILQRLGAQPLYLAATGLGWGLALSLLLWKTLSRWPAAPLTQAYAGLLYFIYYWADRWLMQVDPVKNLPFSVISSILLFLLATAMALFVAAKEEKA